MRRHATTRLSRRLLCTHLTSHPKAVRLPDARGEHRGLRWLQAGFANTLIDTKRGPRLHPGIHGLDARDWLVVDDDELAGSSSYSFQMGLKEAALTDPEQRVNVLQTSDESTLGAQAEVLEMVHAHLRAFHPGRFDEAIEASKRHLDDGACSSPLELAARLVQEDFVLMRHDQASGGYRSVAAAVVFSFADLPKRIGEQHDMAHLHAKVGSYDTDLHAPVQRFMTGLTCDRPVWRTSKRAHPAPARRPWPLTLCVRSPAFHMKRSHPVPLCARARRLVVCLQRPAIAPSGSLSHQSGEAPAHLSRGARDRMGRARWGRAPARP